MARLAWAAAFAVGASLSIELSAAPASPAKPAAPARAAVTPQAWARALAVIDTPQGVQIVYSLYNNQIGNYLTKLNNVAITDAAVLASMLDNMARDGAPAGYSTTVQSAIGPGEPMDTAPPLAAPEAGSNGSLPAAERAAHYWIGEGLAVTPVPADDDTQFHAQWGALARLAMGRPLLRQISQPGWPCSKVFPSQSCLVHYRWEQPGKILLRDWYNEFTELMATDAIVPSALPGVFVAYRAIHRPQSQATGFIRTGMIHASHTHFKEEGRTLSLSVSPYSQPPAGHSKFAYWLQNESLQIVMSAAERATAIEQGARIQAHVRSEKIRREQERRSAARQETMRGVYNALNTVGQAIDQGNRQQQAQFNNQMAALSQAQQADRQRMENNRTAAAREAARASPGATGPAGQPKPGDRTGVATAAAPQPAVRNAPASAVAAAAGRAAPQAAAAPAAPATRTVRMVLLAGILPTEADQKGPNGYGRNPNCQSNIITATIRNDLRSNVPVEELFNRYRDIFLTKCQRLGTVSTGPTYEIEYPYSTRFGQTGWNDRLVTLP